MLTDRKLQEGFTLGLFRPEDAPGIVDCYREVYGDSFPVRYVYDPEAIVKRNSGSEQYTLVVRDPAGLIVGLVGLFAIDGNPGNYEVGQLMVRRRYRHLKLGQALSVAALTELPPLAGVRVLMAEAVCNTTISQKMALEHALLPTGLQLECLPNPEGTPTSLLSLFKIFSDTPHTIHVPGKYLDFVGGCCARLGLTRSYGNGSPPQTTAADPATEKLEFAGLIRCRFAKSGNNFDSWLDDFLETNQRSILQAQVNLGDPAAPWALGLLRERGFCLGAFLPSWFGTDALMVQRLPCRPQFDAIRLLAGDAEAIGNAVQRDLTTVNREWPE
ncbi:GNAT family N-acetyltransferase [Desulfofustis glycolicus]|uniref:N-acetyltransferase domain-containing protein n=1 Tax=Desulfofustis glycolicus DSM 9705 TaxID=1121409 RepID=A0A1M5YFE4_9BACT|nr:GNAT family N-acetyltransferase [Desulfofustis glycolicus]MCB2215213.1 GNAT family N-acetyltransferase [Desulfobulbaceae bacterium]SHI10568.1 hypothetical protein SAMN02745124_03958 [Desulfofustis glycolicus DSM 9705]